MKNNLLVHYGNITAFKKRYFEGVLGTEHLESGKKHFPKLYDIAAAIDWEPDGGLQAYVLERDGVKYLIDFQGESPHDVLPIKITGATQEVAFRNDVYQWIPQWASVRFRSEKKLTFRQLVDQLTASEHSNPTHHKLMCFIALTQYIGRANFRICSQAGFGKDSAAKILGSLVSGCVVIPGKPTIAKLEYRANSSWIVINEMMDITPAEWKNVEMFLLAAGDFSPTLEKHSLGKHYGGLDTYDISDLSISIFYNDIDHYNTEEFFDEIAKGAVKDRFLPMRVHGHFLEDWSASKRIDNNAFAQKHLEDYKNLVYTITYFKDNLHEELHGYDSSILFSVAPELEKKVRWKDSLVALLKIIDLYCETQDEFSAWVLIILAAIKDYEDMLNYKNAEPIIVKRLGPIKWSEKQEKLRLLDTYTEKFEQLHSKKLAGQKDLSQW